MIISIGAVVCFAAVRLMGLGPIQNEASLRKYIEKNEAILMGLAKEHHGRYTQVNDRGIKAIDAREDDVCYIFSWSYREPEGGSFLFYADDGTLAYAGYSLTDDTTIDGLGINGLGYIKCTKLKQNWFYVESIIPT